MCILPRFDFTVKKSPLFFGDVSKYKNFENFFDTKSSNDFIFHINKNIKEADFWIVFEDLKYSIEYCRVPKKNVIYLNNETSFKKNHFFDWENN